MKILVISHLPFSSLTSMGKTLASLFSSFKKTEICQLFIYPTTPNLPMAESSYRITDKEVLASFLGKKINGSIVEADINNKNWIDSKEDENFYRSSFNKTPIAFIMRDTMWFLANWFCFGLRKWLKEQQPDCVFVALGNSCFLYRMAMRVSSFLNIPIVCYVCDDYYFVNNNGFLDFTKIFLLRKVTEKLFYRAKHLVTICDSLSDKYSRYFNNNTTTIMTGNSKKIATNVSNISKIQKLRFFGNTRLNRYISLAEIGKALDEINESKHTNYVLEIFTQIKDSELFNKYKNIKSIKIMGFVSGKEYEEAFNASDVLIHAESFDDEYINLTKNSVSTKIPDILASGKYFIAYGPENIASMKHLIKNNCAGVITSSDNLANQLFSLLSNPKQLQAFAINGLDVAKKYHDSFVQSKKLRAIFEDILSSPKALDKE